MDVIVSYINLFYPPSKYHVFISWQTNAIYIEPKHYTNIKSIVIKYKPPFLDYIVTCQENRSTGVMTKTFSSMGVLNILQVIGHEGN